MRALQAFLASVVAVFVCFALGGQAAAQSPTSTPIPDFSFSSASMQAIVDTVTISSEITPLSCIDYPLAFDSYQWTVKLSQIRGDFLSDLTNNVITVVFGNGTTGDGHTCDFDDISNFLEIPPRAAYVHVDGQGLVQASFEGAVPDFYTIVGEFVPADFIEFNLTYNPSGKKAKGLAPGTGTLVVDGNANLCEALVEDLPPVCFALYLGFESPSDRDLDLACICVTPSVSILSLNSLFGP